ncbi:MAG: hypothetical protein J2P27_10090 [Actinobacteria bacterium]|nr:hypothetical protein [Actinomycetota bacterium]
MIEHGWHGRSAGRSRRLRQLPGPDHQVEGEPHLGQRSVTRLPGGIAQQLVARDVGPRRDRVEPGLLPYALVSG